MRQRSSTTVLIGQRNGSTNTNLSHNNNSTNSTTTLQTQTKATTTSSTTACNPHSHWNQQQKSLSSLAWSTKQQHNSTNCYNNIYNHNHNTTNTTALTTASSALTPSSLLLSSPYNYYYDSNTDNTDIMTANGKSNNNNIVEPTKVPQFAYSEITLGKSVGQGGFSNVSEIIAIDMNDVYDTSEHETALRKDFVRNNASVQSSSGYKYVLKTLRNDLPEEEHQKGVVDLAVEVEFLAVLSHPHIISLRATANSDPYEPRYFVILDRLTQTLDRRFNYWRKMVGENAGYWVPCYGYCCAKSHLLHQIWLERIRVAFDIANALHYLHTRRIIYRDLKPDNIGFDVHNKLKIFDFGLAKRIDEADATADGTYKLTGNTGSLRYMAPDVARDLPYNLSVDVYSFGVIFWQICSLVTPYAGYSPKMHADRVVHQGQRPKPDRSWPMSWTQLMEDCWHANAAVRPSMTAVCDVLTETLDDLEHNDGIVPTRASEIRAKKRKIKGMTREEQKLDVDTRLTSDVDTGIKQVDSELV